MKNYVSLSKKKLGNWVKKMWYCMRKIGHRVKKCGTVWRKFSMEWRKVVDVWKKLALCHVAEHHMNGRKPHSCLTKYQRNICPDMAATCSIPKSPPSVIISEQSTSLWNNSHGLRYSFRHPQDVTVSITYCILGLTGWILSANFEIFQCIACKIWVSKSVIIIENNVVKTCFSFANLQSVSRKLSSQKESYFVLYFVFECQVPAYIFSHWSNIVCLLAGKINTHTDSVWKLKMLCQTVRIGTAHNWCNGRIMLSAYSDCQILVKLNGKECQVGYTIYIHQVELL